VEPLRYSIIIQWSDEDEAYEEALKNGKEVLELVIGNRQELGRPLPEPNRYDAA